MSLSDELYWLRSPREVFTVMRIVWIILPWIGNWLNSLAMVQWFVQCVNCTGKCMILMASQHSIQFSLGGKDLKFDKQCSPAL